MPLEFLFVGAAADDDRAAGEDGLMRGQRFEKDIDTFELAQLTDEHEVRRIVGEQRLVELVAVEAVIDHACRAGRRPDQFAVLIGGVEALEDDAVGERREPPLDGQVKPPRERRW